MTSRRVLLHRAVAEAIEQLHGDRPEWVRGLAFHFSESAHAGGVDKAVDYCRRAGQRALALFAYEESVGHYERALHALDLDPSGGTDDRRVEILLALADAVWRIGGGAPARARYLEAGALAQRLARHDLLVEAALGMTKRSGASPIDLAPIGLEGAPTFDAAQVGLVRAALDATPAADSELRARLLAAMAVAMFYEAGLSQLRELADEACAMAERVADTGALVATLSVRRAVLDRFVPEAEERLALDTRIENLARERSDLASAADALLWRTADLLQLGRVHEADDTIDEYTALTAEFADQGRAYWGLVYRVTRAPHRGSVRRRRTAGDRSPRPRRPPTTPGARPLWRGDALGMARSRSARRAAVPRWTLFSEPWPPSRQRGRAWPSFAPSSASWTRREACGTSSPGPTSKTSGAMSHTSQAWFSSRWPAARWTTSHGHRSCTECSYLTRANTQSWAWSSTTDPWTNISGSSPPRLATSARPSPTWTPPWR